MSQNRTPNPYRPGFNQTPVVFAGRHDILDGADEALEVAAYDGRTPRPLVLVGPRGLGKTVSLGEISDLAAQKLSWPTVHVEAKTGTALLPELIARLDEATSLLGGSIPTTPPDATLPETLDRAARAAQARHAGLVITIDEAQNIAADEMALLGGTLQETVPQNWPIVVAMAALPSLRTNRGPKRLPTYLERAEWHELEFLPDQEALVAISAPAQMAGRPMTDRAAELLLAAAGGYPYAIQVAGHFAWRSSTTSSTITATHARTALPRVRNDLEQLYKGRWADASPRERDYLRALATVIAGTTAPTGTEVAAELGVGTREVSYLRDRLIKKGTIYRDAGQQLRFITPGMADWVRHRDDVHVPETGSSSRRH